MKIAQITSTVRGETDRLLTAVAKQLQAEGKTLGGIVKELSYDSQFDNGCDMKVRVLPDGPIIQITQNLGAGSDACRLDPGAIANAVSAVEGGSLEHVDLFVLNKFGPEEAAGRGFCNVIGKAVEHDIPVLVGVGKGSLDSFAEFAQGLAETIPPVENSILKWCRDSI